MSRPGSRPPGPAPPEPHFQHPGDSRAASPFPVVRPATGLLAEGLQRAGRDVTREKLRTALASVQRFDLGGFVVDYSAASPYVGSRFVDLGVLGAGGRFLG